MSLSVIIPSRTAANLVTCLAAVRRGEPEARIIVVDDGLPDYICEPTMAATGTVWRWIAGSKPFIFARNCNLGIQAAGDDDVILLNDDAILESFAGFRLMLEAAMQQPDYGVISAACNNVGNPAQNRRAENGLRQLGDCPGNSFPSAAFVCVLIPRRTIEAIGLLDERFTAYGWEDNDYCRRLHLAGLKIGVHDGCFVDHAKLQSTFRGDPRLAGKLEEGRKIYLEKWGTM